MALSKIDRHGKPGFNLVRQKMDLSDSRERWVVLTARGKEFAEMLAALG